MPRLYIVRGSPSYTPPTIRGAWERTNEQIARALQTAPDEPNLGAVTSNSSYETTTLATNDQLVIRAITAPLAANYTFSGTLNVMLAVQQTFSNSANCFYIHAYVTTGNSDTVRGTLLANYVDTTGNDWSTTAAAKALLAAQTLSGVAAQAGDRIVVEIGFKAKNTFSTQQFGIIYYGGPGPDILSGGAPTSGAGYIDFSDTFTLTETQQLRVTQLANEVVRYQTDAQVRATQLVVEAVRRPTAPPVRISQMVIEVVRDNELPLPTTTVLASTVVIAT